MRQTRALLRCGSASATSAPRGTSIVARGPVGSGPIGVESAAAIAVTPPTAAAANVAAKIRFILLTLLVWSERLVSSGDGLAEREDVCRCARHLERDLEQVNTAAVVLTNELVETCFG